MRDKIKLAKHIVYASRAAKVAKASRLGIYASAILTFLIFAISYYGQRVGNFTFVVDRMATRAGITMFENIETRAETSLLYAPRVDNADGMTALCGTEYTFVQPGSDLCIPSDEVVGAVDGNNSKYSYLAYTFYVANAGDKVLDLESVLTIIDESKGAIHAIRVRVIFDGVGTTYASAQTALGANPGQPEVLTERFLSLNQVLDQTFERFEPGQILKVTVLIWYEGEDADHNNAILGGGVKFKMDFKVTNVYDEGF